MKKKQRLAVDLDGQLKRKLNIQAAKEGRKLREIIIELVDNYLKGKK